MAKVVILVVNLYTVLHNPKHRHADEFERLTPAEVAEKRPDIFSRARTRSQKSCYSQRSGALIAGHGPADP